MNAVMQQHSYPCHCTISHDLASNLSLRIKLFRALYTTRNTTTSFLCYLSWNQSPSACGPPPEATYSDFATAFSTIQEHAKYNGGSIEVCTQDAEFELDELDELD
jgi:hypothetical protein